MRPRSVRVTAFVLSCALLSGSLPALAQPAKAPAKAAPGKAAKKKTLKESLSGEALEAFNRGVELYSNAKNYEGAVSEFQRAYTLSKDPRLLFNMAIAERDAKRYARAVTDLELELKEGNDSLSDAEKETARGLLEELKKFTAPITVTSNENDATVLVDNIEVGKTPLAQPIIADVGDRNIVVRKAGFLEASKRVAVSGGKAEKLEFTLEATQKKGKLVVKALGAPEATVYVDNVKQGPSPWEGEVTADKHTIEIRAKGFVTETRTETVSPAQPTIIEATLRVDQGRVRVESDKPENVIAIDGKEIGRGTWEGVLSTGNHRLDVTRSGTSPHTSTVTVQTDQLSTVRVTLTGKGGVPWYAWVIGGGVLIGGGIATYFLAKPGTKDPQPGTIQPGTVAVRYRF